MKIESSVISMAGRSSSMEISSKQENLNFWVGNQRPAQVQVLIPSQLDIVDISEEGKSLLSHDPFLLADVEKTEDLVGELSDRERHKILLLEKLLEFMSGKRVKIRIPEKIRLDTSKLDINIRQAPQSHGWGLEYDYHESYYESQKMTFSSEGTVKTADGREISFSVDLSMSREFISQKDIRIRAGDAKIDPLAVNFGSGIPQLTDQKYSFDIDSDGKPDQISFLTQGSGFLALDLNMDGVVNNGKELFGPETGNGFSELARYDSDGNNWIDENDPIFDKLRIWTKDPDGTDRLFAIGEKGIGAIYLGNVDTQFDLKNSNNTSLGEIRKTGIFLKENGTVGTINHIDLTI